MAVSTEEAQGVDMASNDNILGSTRRFRLTAEVTTLMLQGAGYAALFCTVILLAALVLLAVSRSLPDASKDAADPTPELSMGAPAEMPSLI
jgi:hypothetical protein